jgi:DNA processing protein
MDPLLFRAALGRLPRLSARLVRDTLHAVGDMAALAARPLASLAELGWPPEALQALRQLESQLLAQDLAACEPRAIRLIAAGEHGYPQSLLEVEGAPPLLYVRGDAAALSLPQLAMVGSRNPSGAGRAIARDFAVHFARCGLTITSGLALGIDAASHEGALAGGGHTIAVCGTGLDIDYPAEHADLAARIAARGALVSEFPPGSPARPAHFPQRNRIISGLSLGVLVVEAARRSGSLITARYAGEQGRSVWAVPGSIHSPQSHGCHQLIRTGATLVESAVQVLEDLQISLENQLVEQVSSPSQATSGQPLPMDKDYEILLHALGFAPASLDQLVARTGLPSGSIASMLLMLELQGMLETRPGGRYQRLGGQQGPG